MNASHILSAWALPDARILEDLGGINNRSSIVAASGSQYILRVYRNVGGIESARAEHELLAELSSITLPFATPIPLPAGSGETLVPVEVDGRQTFAALFPLLPGTHPEAGDEEEYRRYGAALAELDRALAALSAHERPGLRGAFEHLERQHPLVPDVFAMAGSLPLEPAIRRRVAAVLEDLTARLPALYATLPRQLVHRDFDASNVLVEDGRVNGVLDFEFAGHDLRVIDPGLSLAGFYGHPWNRADMIDSLRAFAAGYQSVLALTDAEIAALPVVMLLFRAISLISREGRRRQGIASDADVISRANELLRMDVWLRDRGCDDHLSAALNE